MTAVTTKIDVRAIPVWLRHPKIFAAFDKLPIEGRLEIVSDHEPRPLRYEFDVERPGEFGWEQQLQSEGEWHVTIRRLARESAAPNAASFLRRSSLLTAVDETAREQLIATLHERALKSGDVIADQGDAFPYLGFVQAGVVSAIAVSSGGRDHVIYEALPFETFAEMEVFDGATSATRFVASHGGARVILLPRSSVLDACHRSSMLSLRLGTAVAHRMRMLIERAEALAFSSITSRVARALLPYAAAAEGLAHAIPPLPHMSQSEIATLAGTVRVVAARALAELSDAGAIELVRGRIVRIDRAVLSALGRL